MEYDYIIVGGGSSGCLAAGRLVREQSASVMVIEAGMSNHNPLIRMPAGFVKLLGIDKYMWFYETEDQPRLGNRHPVIPQGRVLGGGSSVNAMVYMRGQAQDFKAWGETSGTSEWDLPHLLPHFRRVEGNGRLNNRLHGVDGPMKVSDPREVCELSKAFVAAALAAGHPENTDFNGGRQTGAGLFQVNIHRGRRCSAADAYLAPLGRDPNLTVQTGALVQRVLIEKGRAVGVEYRHKGRTLIARAKTEVVMAAGALATPKLLMLSGIGPAAELQRHSIPVLAALPGVGQNLQDHTEVPVLSFCNGPYGYFGQDRGWNTLRNGLQYLLLGTGPVGSNGVEAGAFLNPDSASEDASIQMFCVPSIYFDKDVKGIEATHGITLNACLMRPKSRGSVRLRSADPDNLPRIDPNYFDHPDDLRLSVAGLRAAREILAAEPLAGMIDREVRPGPEITDDAGLADHARRTVKTVYHPVGTCRMGHDDDPMAVLSPDLRVRGVAGLRVIDASMMPNIVSGNTNAAVMAVADKAVDLMMGFKALAPISLADAPLLQKVSEYASHSRH